MKETPIAHCIASCISDSYYRSHYVYASDHSPSFILHKAAKCGDIETISLLACNDNINVTTSDGKSALHYAAENNQLQAVELLIKLGINTKIRDDNGNTARDLLSSTLQVSFDHLVSLPQHNIKETEIITDVTNISSYRSLLGANELNEDQNGCDCTGCCVMSESIINFV